MDAPLALAFAAQAFVGFRLRHRNMGTINSTAAESEPSPSTRSLDQAAT